MSKRLTISSLSSLKATGKKITVLTAYDYPTAVLAEQSGIDLLLVGDSLGMVVLGYASTVPVTMEEILHHTRAVARGARQTLVVEHQSPVKVTSPPYTTETGATGATHYTLSFSRFQEGDCG